MVIQVVAVLGQIDGVVAYVGVLSEFKPQLKSECSDIDTLLYTNLCGTFLAIKHCLPVLSHGAIVIKASWTAASVMPGAGPYDASKGALLAMMKTRAVEPGLLGVRVIGGRGVGF